MIEAFLERWPNGQHGHAAQARIGTLEKGAAEARAAEQQLTRETAEWSAVAESTDIQTINAFLERWPDGQHADGARARIAALNERRKSASAGSRQPKRRRPDAGRGGTQAGRAGGAQAPGPGLWIFMAGAVIVTGVLFLIPNGPPIRRRDEDRGSRRKAEEAAARRDPALSVQPGFGQSFRDRLANGQPCPTCPEMVVVPNGKFTMGSPDSEPERDSNEDQVSVSIAKPFAVGKFAVTRGEFAAFVEETGHKTDGGCYTWSVAGWKLQANKSWRAPGFAQDDRHPVVCVSWDDAKAYATWLSSKTGKTYRLLSEAEREYVTRAGTTTPFWWGTSITPMQANYDGNFLYAGGGSKGENRQRTEPVDSFNPNPWGLYNVHGNVWDWTEDCWNGSNNGNPGNGRARTTGDCSAVSFVAALGATVQGASARPSAAPPTSGSTSWACGSAGRFNP